MHILKKTTAMTKILMVCFINCLDKGSGLCNQQIATIGHQNVQLTFNYSWSSQELKSIECNKDQTIIGRCVALNTSDCSVELTSVGVFYISSNDELTSIIVTISRFNETMSGTYSCFKTKKDDMKSVCLAAGPATITTATTQTATSHHAPNAFTEVTNSSNTAAKDASDLSHCIGVVIGSVVAYGMAISVPVSVWCLKRCTRKAIEAIKGSLQGAQSKINSTSSQGDLPHNKID
ncbi:uncharacterized protein LOC127878783 [Dreissena polymorpha]|uniref:uncharacterized protein LOC127878783 n=1 Tax=Dreissena polymorpha TaxID=45954 RepID=UPI00226531A1|nr:uncharacterized protein LOC127878783 [Dreissena polymorpha]